MKVKNLLRFYFSAGSLNAALDNIIMRLAMSSGLDVYAGCATYFSRILEVVEAKNELSHLWARLDGIISAMTGRDRAALKRYAAARVGLQGGDKREIHRAAVKFARRAGGLVAGEESAFKLLSVYRCLMNPAPD